jgi:ribosomal protein S27AE
MRDDDLSDLYRLESVGDGCGVDAEDVLAEVTPKCGRCLVSLHLDGERWRCPSCGLAAL